MDDSVYFQDVGRDKKYCLKLNSCFAFTVQILRDLHCSVTGKRKCGHCQMWLRTKGVQRLARKETCTVRIVKISCVLY